MAFAALLDGLQIKSHEEVLADFKAHPKLVDYADAFADGVETGAAGAPARHSCSYRQPPTYLPRSAFLLRLSCLPSYLGLRFCCAFGPLAPGPEKKHKPALPDRRPRPGAHSMIEGGKGFPWFFL